MKSCPKRQLFGYSEQFEKRATARSFARSGTITGTIATDENEIHEEFIRASGPGEKNVRMSRVTRPVLLLEHGNDTFLGVVLRFHPNPLGYFYYDKGL